MLARAMALSVRLRAITLNGLTFIIVLAIITEDIAMIVESSLSDCMIANGKVLAMLPI